MPERWHSASFSSLSRASNTTTTFNTISSPAPDFTLGQNAKQVFWAFYWAMTGIHAIHLAIGIALVLRLFWLLRSRQISDGSPQFEVASLYWHLVDAFWLVLFPVLYVAARG